eukprot:6439835-Amphidinium_carterae.2
MHDIVSYYANWMTLWIAGSTSVVKFVTPACGSPWKSPNSSNCRNAACTPLRMKTSTSIPHVSPRHPRSLSTLTRLTATC